MPGWIAEAAAKASNRTVKPVDELPPEALVDLAPTEKLQAELAQITLQLDRHEHAQRSPAPSDGEGPGVDPGSLRAAETLDQATLNTLRMQRRIVTRKVAEAEERDRRAVVQKRPAGCWCLGLGGRGERGRAGGGMGIDVIERRWTTDYIPLGELVVFAEYCPCPDGARVAGEHLEAMQAAIDRMSAERTDRELKAHWADVGLPENSVRYPNLVDFPTGDERQAKAFADVQAWQPPRFLYLHGPTRRGKTTLAAALARRADALHWSVRFRTMHDILERLKAAMDEEDESVDKVMQPMLDVDLLVIDDLGEEPSTRWALSQIFRLIDKRLTKERTTIITSNFDLGRSKELSLAAHIISGAREGADADFRMQAGRIVARLKEASDVVFVDGPALEPARAEALPW